MINCADHHMRPNLNILAIFVRQCVKYGTLSGVTLDEILAKPTEGRHGKGTQRHMRQSTVKIAFSHAIPPISVPGTLSAPLAAAKFGTSVAGDRKNDYMFQNLASHLNRMELFV